MKIVPQPDRRGEGPEDSWAAELDAALDHGTGDPTAGSWRELRDDVRALAPAMAPAFQQQLERQIAERRPRRGPAGIPRPRRGRAGAPTDRRSSDSPGARRAGRGGRLPGWWRPEAGLRLGAFVATVVAVAAALLLFAPWRSGTPLRPVVRPVVHATSAGPTSGSVHGPARPSQAAGEAAASSAAGEAAGGEGATEGAAPALSAPTSPSGRLQQLSASIGLSTTPGGVQSASDRVARLAVDEGGYVQSSQVQVQRAGTGEASLMLRLPSAKLGAALAALARLAPVSSESQSTQDITGAYDAARRRLSDAGAERRALLRALARADTEAQIESLRQRLSEARNAIDRASSEVHRVSGRASTAEVEVTVLGSRRAGGQGHAQSDGLSLRRGLHDAVHVLTVVAVVLLIAAAILLPLALLLAALIAGYNGWRGHRRERVLDAR